MRTCGSWPSSISDMRARRSLSPASARDLGEEAGVDLVDDLQQAGQQLAEQAHRPALQGLGQQGVVGVGHGGGGDAQASSHSRDARPSAGASVPPPRWRVGVVELEAVLLGEVAEIPAMQHLPLAPAHPAGWRRPGNIAGAGAAPCRFAGVVGVEHHGDVLGGMFLADGLGIATGVEILRSNSSVAAADHRRRVLTVSLR
jgi:hypothetical protein